MTQTAIAVVQSVSLIAAAACDSHLPRLGSELHEHGATGEYRMQSLHADEEDWVHPCRMVHAAFTSSTPLPALSAAGAPASLAEVNPLQPARVATETRKTEIPSHIAASGSQAARPARSAPPLFGPLER